MRFATFGVDLFRAVAICLGHSANFICFAVDAVGNRSEGGEDYITDHRHVKNHLEGLRPEILNIDDKANTVFLTIFGGGQWGGQRGDGTVDYIRIFALPQILLDIFAPYEVAVKSLQANIFGIARLMQESDGEGPLHL